MYSYNRIKTASFPTFLRVRTDWLADVAYHVAEAIPGSLKSEGVRVNAGTQENVSRLVAMGLSQSGRLATTKISLSLGNDFDLLSEVSIVLGEVGQGGRGDTKRFSLPMHRSPSQLSKEIGEWLANF